MMTALFVLHVIALMTQTFASQNNFDELRCKTHIVWITILIR